MMPDAELARWKPLFWLAAAYNLSAALGACAYGLHMRLFFTLERLPADPVTFFYHVAFWLCVFVFGIGYALVALHPTRYPGILILAVIGKLGVFLIFTLTYLSGLGSLMMLLGGVGDLIFALLFLTFLRRFFSPGFDSH